MANQADAVEEIGLGVDLIGGPETLVQLRAIRVEMEAIINLSGRGPTGPGGTGSLQGPITQASLTEQQKIARATVAITKEATEQEISILAQANIAKRLQAQRIKDEELRLLREQEEKKLAIIRNYERQAEEARARVRNIALNDRTIRDENLTSQRNAFRKYRNDPARDEQTNIYRQEIADRLKAQRSRDRIIQDEYERNSLNARARVQAIAEDPTSLYRDDLTSQRRAFRKHRNDPARDEQTNIYRQEIADRIKAYRQINANARQQFDLIDKERAAYLSFDNRRFYGNARENRERTDTNRNEYFLRDSRIQRDVFQENLRERERQRNQPLEDLRVRLGYGLAGSNVPIESPSIEEIRRRRDALSNRRRLREHLESGGTLANFTTGGGPGGGGPPEEDDEGGGGGKGKRGGGLAGQIGRITRNFILYRVLSEATFGLARYTEESLKAAKATSEQGNALLFATDAAHGNLEANRALAEQIGTLGFNRAQARQVVATAARATFRHPELTNALVKEATDIAALRGGGIEKTPEVIEDIIGGRDRAYRELLNITPEEIYKEAGKKHLAQQTNLLGLKTVGKQDYETDKQRVDKYVAALTEQEKEELRLNYVLSQSFRFQGDAAERATTLAGKMDLVSAGFYNASANVGAFITELRPVKNILTSLANIGPGELFAPPELKRTGPRNTITDANISNYVTDKIRAYDINLESIGSPPGFGVLPKSGVTINPATILDKLLKISGEGLFTPPVYKELSDTKYDAIINENIAKAQQAKQRAVLEQQGQIGYRAVNPGDGLANQYFTYEELTAKGLDSDTILKNYIKDIKPVLLDGQQALIDYRKEYARLQDVINAGVKAGDESSVNAATKAQQLLAAKEDARFLAGFAPPDVEQHFAESEAKRRQKEEQEVQKHINRVGRALSQLREIEQGSFRVVSEVANTLEPNNPFVKPLTDIATTRQRVEAQYGGQGPAAVEYYNNLYSAASKKELTRLDFQSYRASTAERNQIARERDQREGPGLSRQQQDYLDIQQQIVNQAIKIPELWKEAAKVLGITIGPQEDLLNQVTLISRAFGARGPISGPTVFDTNIFGANSAQYKFQKQFGNPLFLPGGEYAFQRRSGNPLFLPGGAEEFQRTHGNPLYETSTNPLANIGAGQSPDVRQALQKSFSDSLLDAFKNYSPAQIRSSGLQSYYLGALQVQASQLPYNIEQARLKSEYGAKEDTRLQKQLEDDETLRRRKIAAGEDADTVGQSSDELILARTEGISPKDLSFRQFKARQDAQQRQVTREENKRKEAEAAVEKAKKAQEDLYSDVAQIRQAIYEGKMSMLVQVENNSQAAIDEANLADMAQGRYNIPMDTSKSRSSSYSDGYEKYKRGGRKR